MRAETTADPELTLGEGRTPLVMSRRLGPLLRLARLELKLELQNPSGSWVDRAVVAVVAAAWRQGFARVGVVGDTELALSVGTYAARAGLGGVFIGGPGVSPEVLARLARLGTRIIEVAADPARIARTAAAAARRPGLHLVYSDEVLAAEGLEGLACELAEQGGTRQPDLVVMGSAIADPLALARGFRRRHAAAPCPSEPAIVVVDPASINPRDLRAATRLLAAEEGLLVGTPAAAATAALIRLSRSKGFDRAARIVLVLSGGDLSLESAGDLEPVATTRTDLRGLARLLRSGFLESPISAGPEGATLGTDGGLR